MPKIYLVQFNVDDIDKAIDWYTEVLGFRVSKRNYHHPVAVDLVHKNIRVILHKANFINGRYPPDGRTLVAMEVEDIVKKLRELKRNGVEVIHKKPLDFPLGKYAAIKDPFGNTHELVELTKSKRRK